MPGWEESCGRRTSKPARALPDCASAKQSSVIDPLSCPLVVESVIDGQTHFKAKTRLQTMIRASSEALQRFPF